MSLYKSYISGLILFLLRPNLGLTSRKQSLEELQQLDEGYYNSLALKTGLRLLRDGVRCDFEAENVTAPVWTDTDLG
ncbi:hypothetical protein F5Y07DRAFT_347679 [Xylaria sp. FL0933]|nr:hypothetical protein F5Y07DRAFT_347679 [Xylaria sp. FL0933]